MFAYTSKLQLALSDKMRRAGLAAGAGVVLVIGAGFLLAALWTYLAHHLGWGSLGASLAIGGVMVLIALTFLMMAKTERHRTPSTDELRAEVQQQLNLLADTALEKASVAADQTLDRALTAADDALDRASDKAIHLMDRAQQRVHSVVDDLGYRASSVADQAEARVYGTARRVGEETAERFGVLSSAVSRGAGKVMDKANSSNAATLTPVLGAFAVGITLASRLQAWRHRDDDEEWDDDDDQY